VVVEGRVVEVVESELKASGLLKILNKVAGRVSGCVFVKQKCNWARWVYCMRLRGGTPVSTSKAV